jgi:hypothetical protein
VILGRSGAFCALAATAMEAKETAAKNLKFIEFLKCPARSH